MDRLDSNHKGPCLTEIKIMKSKGKWQVEENISLYDEELLCKVQLALCKEMRKQINMATGKHG